MITRSFVRRSIGIAVMLAAPTLAHAGGGGQNMLLLVDPSNEASLRIANAYAAARAIPDRNIMFIETPRGVGYSLNNINVSSYTSLYRDAVPAAIAARGLNTQIDYIGTVGTPHAVSGSAPNSSGGNTTIKQSFNYMMSTNTQFSDGMLYPSADFRRSELYQVDVPASSGGTVTPLPYTAGTNAAISHNIEYALTGVGAPGETTAQWRMSGNVGYAGTHAIATQTWVDRYRNIPAADGTKPTGTVYYMENADIRSNTREPFWPSVQQYMASHGIAYQQLSGTTPVNKNDVNGAVVGSPDYLMPRGSTYLPGSYADSLTSYGSFYNSSLQTKADKFIRYGAAGTAGTINEPFAIADRFTDSMIYVYSAEGSTLGEAMFKSVARPDLLMFQGDLLSQAHADVPTVTLTAPSTGAGTVSIDASAALNAPDFATGISKLQLFVDGVNHGEISAASGTFDLDTTSLFDGEHEVRVVAINNAAAASQGYALSNLTVNNRGQSVSTLVPLLIVQNEGSIFVPVTAVPGTGTVDRVELRSLGRNVATLAGAAGLVPLDGSQLAFGSNKLVPVAVMTDGSEVAGKPITVQREFDKISGNTPPVPAARRIPGLRFEHFTAAAGNTLDTINFNRPADHVSIGGTLVIDPDSTTSSRRNMPGQYLNGNNADLAIRVTASFLVTQEGEWGFFFDTNTANYESLRLSVDDLAVLAHEFYNGSTFSSGGMTSGADTFGSLYLRPGEHDLELLLGNPQGDADDRLTMVMWLKDPSGNIIPVDSSRFYSEVPEPTAAALLLPLALGMRRRR